MTMQRWARGWRQIKRIMRQWPWFALVLATAAQGGMIDHQGMAPYEICGMCHNLDGISHMAKFPKLAGQKAAYIKKQFMDFRAGRRTNDGAQMSGITSEVGPAHIDAIATYFSQLPAPPAAPLPDDLPSQRLYRKGAVLFREGRDGIAACATCHGAQAEHQPLSPWLDAQHQDYLTKQLGDFKQGLRHNDPGAVMQSVAAKLTEEDIAALARYLASTSMRR